MKSRNGGGIACIQKTALFSALMVICAWISIPFVPPITLQLFALSLSLYLIGAWGIAACAVYLSLGIIGLPVFAGFSGGIGHLLGAGGGYLIGMLAFSVLYICLVRLFGDGRIRRIVFSLISLVVLYLIGSIWYTFIYLGGDSASFISSLLVTVLPFILPDIIKILLADLLALRLRRFC